MNKIKKPYFLKISEVEKILLAKQLSLMLKSGVPIIDALNFLEKQSRSTSLKYILKSTTQDLEKGLSLANSLKKFSNQFGELFLNIIEVGEISGNLDKNLEYLAEELKKQRELKGKIISSFIYPAFILTATLGIIFLMIFIVFPKIMPIFTELKVKLPLTTIIFIKVSTFLLKFWYLVLISFFVFIFLLYFLLKIKKIKFFWDKMMIYLPFLGTIVRYSNFVSFCRSLGLLIESGLDITRSLAITAKTINNLFYQKLFEEALFSINQGHPLQEFFSKKAKYFDNVFINLLEVGEKAGSLQSNLFYLANYYEESLSEKLKNFVTLLEPILLALMGVMVAFIALAIIMPIYQITQQIGK